MRAILCRRYDRMTDRVAERTASLGLGDAERLVHRHEGIAQIQSGNTTEASMARSKGSGDKRGVRRDGPGGAGAPWEASASDEARSGQQSGSKRPRVKTGAAARA